MKLIQAHLLGGSFSAIGSHDHNIIAKVKEFVKTHHIPNEQYEFQMLYGFRTELQEQLVKEGYNMQCLHSIWERLVWIFYAPLG